MQRNSVGMAYSQKCLLHVVPGHPESPERLSAVINHLRAEALLPKLHEIAVKQAEIEDLLLVHSREHVDKIARACAQGTAAGAEAEVCAQSQEAALWSAGCVLSSVEAICGGEVGCAFALGRPPGHHAGREAARGFCLYNNAAIGAAYALERLGLERVLIVDWDVHHGNGTQEIFYEEPRVTFFSIHQFPLYPGTGIVQEQGRGAGLGHTVNVPLPPGCGDADYLHIFENVLAPLFDACHPQLIIVSAGFDAHRLDPLAGMELTSEGYARFTQWLRAKAAGVGLLFVLEGGYHLGALVEGVAGCFRALLGEIPQGAEAEESASNFVVNLAEEVVAIHSDYWKE